jgi:gas vesicle protein
MYAFGAWHFSHQSGPRTGDSVTNTNAQSTRDRGFFIAVIAGGVVGAGLAMYFAPRAASELRKRMSGSARNLRDAATQRYQRTSARVGETLGEMTRKSQTVRAEVADTAARGAREVELLASSAKPDRRTRLGKKLPAAGSRAKPGKAGQE